MMFFTRKQKQYVDSKYGVVIRLDKRNKKLYVRNINDSQDKKEPLVSVSVELALRIKEKFQIRLYEYGTQVS